MIVRLNRWQPRSNRYRAEILDLSEVEPFVDLLFNRGAMVAHEPGVKQTVMRTQHVDRVLVNAVDNTIDVWLSPVVDRKYTRAGERTHEGMTAVSKKRLNAVTCECHHMESDHSKPVNDNRARICLIPGCRCSTFTVRTSSTFDDLMEQSQ